MADRPVILSHAVVPGLKYWRTPRSMAEAFGPYATLPVKRRDPDRIVAIGIFAVSAALAALLVSGALT